MSPHYGQDTEIAERRFSVTRMAVLIQLPSFGRIAKGIRSRGNKVSSSACQFRRYHDPVRAIVLIAIEQEDSFLGPRIGQRISLPLILGRHSRRFRDFPAFRPCVTPTLATSTRTRVLRSQTTLTRRIAALTSTFPTAKVKARVDPRTSSQRIPSSNHTPTDPVRHTWRSSSKSARSNAGRLRSACPA
jgi:hypothetical protein